MPAANQFRLTDDNLKRVMFRIKQLEDHKIKLTKTAVANMLVEAGNEVFGEWWKPIEHPIKGRMTLLRWPLHNTKSGKKAYGRKP